MEQETAYYEKTSEVYYEAAEILRKANEKRATLKTLIYASKSKNIRQLFAVVNECVKFRPILQEVLSHCSSAMVNDDVVDGKPEVAVILLYECLLGRKFGRAASLRKFAQFYKQEIKSAVDKVLQAHNANTLQEAAQDISERISIKVPRYMRVNLIKSGVDAAIKELESEGWKFIGKIEADKFSEKVCCLKLDEFGLDSVLFDLLIFPSGTDLHDHPLTNSGVLVQQDRASCIPAHVLSPHMGSVVLDCCAAPGNKTSHLASLMKDNGRVIALDRDFKRMSTMSRLLERSGATCVELIHQDFLTVQPGSEDAKEINYILVDPSCSGSGMLNSQYEKLEEGHYSHRLQTLKRFQISILKHALRFPNVTRVVYSTCSVHKEENEQVVEEVMAQVAEYFQFHPVFPEWKGSRGLEEYQHHESFLRLSPQHDLTQGFFVACFERVKTKQSSVVDKEKSASTKFSVSNGNNKRNENRVSALDLSIVAEQCPEDDPLDQESLHIETDRKKKKKKQGKKRKRPEITEVASTTETAEDISKEKKSRKKKKRKLDTEIIATDTELLATDHAQMSVRGNNETGKPILAASYPETATCRDIIEPDSCRIPGNAAGSKTKKKKRKKQTVDFSPDNLDSYNHEQKPPKSKKT